MTTLFPVPELLAIGLFGASALSVAIRGMMSPPRQEVRLRSRRDGDQTP